MKQLLALLVCWKHLNYSSGFILNPNLIKCFLCAYTAHDICLVSRVKACFRQASKDEWINVQLPSRLIQCMQNLIYIYHIFVTQESKIYATSPQNNENSILLSKSDIYWTTKNTAHSSPYSIRQYLFFSFSSGLDNKPSPHRNSDVFKQLKKIYKSGKHRLQQALNMAACNSTI